jgi:hypothetical protein
MKLVEHLEHVIGLVEREAPYPEIARGLRGMQEELHGTQAAAANEVKLRKKYEKLKKAKLGPPRTSKGRIILTPEEQQHLEDLIDEKTRAGLPFEDAHEVSYRQLEHDRVA